MPGPGVDERGTASTGVPDAVSEQGQGILEVFKEAERGIDRSLLKEEYTTIRGMTTTRSRNPPGSRLQPESFEIGNFSDKNAEELIDEGRLPRGLDRQVKIFDADGKEIYRMDRVDWKERVIYEVKPDTRAEILKGQDKLKVYIDYMERTTGKKWKGKVVTYDKKAVTGRLREIGYLPAKPTERGRGKPAPPAPARKLSKPARQQKVRGAKPGTLDLAAERPQLTRGGRTAAGTQEPINARIRAPRWLAGKLTRATVRLGRGTLGLGKALASGLVLGLVQGYFEGEERQSAIARAWSEQGPRVTASAEMAFEGHRNIFAARPFDQFWFVQEVEVNSAIIDGAEKVQSVNFHDVWITDRPQKDISSDFRSVHYEPIFPELTWGQKLAINMVDVRNLRASHVSDAERLRQVHDYIVFSREWPQLSHLAEPAMEYYRVELCEAGYEDLFSADEIELCKFAAEKKRQDARRLTNRRLSNESRRPLGRNVPGVTDWPPSE